MNRERVVSNSVLYFMISKAVLELTDILNALVLGELTSTVIQEVQLRAVNRVNGQLVSPILHSPNL